MRYQRTSLAAVSLALATAMLLSGAAYAQAPASKTTPAKPDSPQAKSEARRAKAEAQRAKSDVPPAKAESPRAKPEAPPTRPGLPPGPRPLARRKEPCRIPVSRRRPQGPCCRICPC